MRRNIGRQGKINKALFVSCIIAFFMLFIFASPVHCTECKGCDDRCGEGCQRCWTDCDTSFEKVGEDYQDLGWKRAQSFKDPSGNWWVVWNHYARHGTVFNKMRICQEYCWCGTTKQYEATGEPVITLLRTVTMWDPKEIISTETLKRGEHP